MIAHNRRPVVPNMKSRLPTSLSIALITPVSWYAEAYRRRRHQRASAPITSCHHARAAASSSAVRRLRA